MADDVIKIDLTQPLTTSFLNKDSIIHKHSFDKIKKLLENIVKNNNFVLLNNQHLNSPLSRQLLKKTVNNTIFIHGKRGAGKTTFIKSVLNYYLDENNSNGILPIAFIDPTLTHTHQHILVDIIVKINMMVEEKFKYCCDDEQRQSYRESLNGMSEGLKLLKNYQPNQSHDAQWFMSNALKESKHGQVLEEKFHDYINSVTKILGTQLLLIAIDDVDTETKEAYEVLEIIRSTITHPKICIILTGDESLYNFIVHEKKLESLGQLPSRQRGEVSSDLKFDMAMHLTQQYLLKVLPAHQRLELEDLYSILNSDESVEVTIKNTADQNNPIKNIDMKVFWLSVFKKGLFLVDREAEKFVNFILQQPIRSIIQIAHVLSDIDFLNNSNPTILVDVFSKVFYNELFNEKFDMEILNNTNLSANSIGKIMVELYAKHGELETGFYARPDSNNAMFNASQIVLSSLIASYSTYNPKLNRNSTISNTIASMLSTGAACNFLMNYVPDYNLDNRWKDYVNYIGLSNKDDIYSVAAHYSPIILNSTNISKGSGSLVVKSGVIRTLRKSKTEIKDYLKSLPNTTDISKNLINSSGTLSKLSKVTKEILNSNNGKGENHSSVANALALIACNASGHSIIASRGANDYISCYTLLAFIAELLNVQDGKPLEKVFFQRLEVPTYGSPSFISNIDTISLDEEDIDEEADNQIKIEEDKDAYNYILNIITQWNIDAERNINEFRVEGISSILQGKIWTRIFYSLNRVSEELRKKGFFGSNKRIHNKYDIGLLLHEIMTINIVAMINAVMIEESRFHIPINDHEVSKKIYEALLTAENVATKLDKFEESLLRLNSILEQHSIKNKLNESLGLPKQEFENINDLRKFLPITYSLMTCPLLIPFLIYPIHNFDNVASKMWKESNKLQEIMKAILQEQQYANHFIDENGDLVDIDMRYISALPILKA